MSSSIPKNINGYMIIEEIGKGASSHVFKAIHLKSKQFVALKCFSKEKITQKMRDVINEEARIMATIDFPFIISYLETFEDQHHIYVSMEYAERGTLFEFLKIQHTLNDKIVQKIFVQLSYALNYLHNELKISHGDIKAENIMLDKFFNVKLIDFGLSEFFIDENSQLTNYSGSPNYLAPELIRHEKFTCRSDVWSLGVLLFMMTFGRFPYEDKDINALLHKIATDPMVIPEHGSADLKSVLLLTLEKDRLKRGSIKDVISCQYVNNAAQNDQYSGVAGNQSLFSSTVMENNEPMRLMMSHMTGSTRELDICQRLFKRKEISENTNRMVNNPVILPRSWKTISCQKCSTVNSRTPFKKIVQPRLLNQVMKCHSGKSQSPVVIFGKHASLLSLCESK